MHLTSIFVFARPKGALRLSARLVGVGAESEAGAKSGAGVESEEEQQEEEVEEEDLIPKRRSSCDVLSNDTLTWKQIALT